MQAQESGKSECLTVMVRIGVEILPHGKPGRLPQGLSTRENLMFWEKREFVSMDVENKQATSTSPQADSWPSINWNKAHRLVRNFQVRIVKATQEGKKRKVRALQNILTRSLAAKQLAVKRVTENQGKKTPGVDRETWSTPKSKDQGVLSLKRRGYKPSPLRRIYIPKSNGKKRPLGIPTMRDRAMQALYLMALEPIVECQADANSYGFRPERCPADAIAQVFNILSKKTSSTWVLEGDIKGCFDNISHQWLMSNVLMDKGILHKWLSCGYLDKNVFNETIKGTPQGGIISPALANAVLDGLEKVLTKHFGFSKDQRNKNRVNLIRFADDFVITGITREILANKVKPLVSNFLKERGLELSEEKTKIVNVKEGFDFLGQNIRKYGSKLLIKPAQKSIKALLGKVKTIIKENRSAKQQNLINILNPVILGWGNYHQHVVSKETFYQIDYKIWNMLWRWAKYRHPNKNGTWISNRYFHKVGTIQRRFSVTIVKDKRGRTSLNLVRLGEIPIRRHIKIKAEANPFDKKWENYFEERLLYKMEARIKGYKKLISLWKRQKGICPRCQQYIELETHWNIHHLVPKCRGGKDNQANLVLLHPNCHRSIHSRESSEM